MQAPEEAGMLDSLPSFSSRYLKPRQVDIWLPPGYDHRSGSRYPVLYMHDGQNLFTPDYAYGGVDWGIDPIFTHLIQAGVIRPVIVVGIWNTDRRWQEYLPLRPLETPQGRKARAALGPEFADGPLADAYLKLIVEELKPAIDARYPTASGQQDTFIMGSSMGGLVSLYAICEYPHIFAGAGCLSTHWLPVAQVIQPYLEAALPDPQNHRIYFDHGTETLDQHYAPHQQKVDQVMRQKGYTLGENWQSLKFEGAEHSEKAWRERLEIPAQFLLG